VGDGCFGREARTVDAEPRWYDQVEASVPHFWLVNVTPEGLTLKAIDAEGSVRDEFTLP